MNSLKNMLLLPALALCVAMSAQNSPTGKPWQFTDAATLTFTGKLMTDTPNPYHRVDTTKYKGFTPTENYQVRMGAGIAIAFRTDSPDVSVTAEFGEISYPKNTNGLAARGFDLYIRSGEPGNKGPKGSKCEWLWAASACASTGHEGENLVIIKNMDGKMKDCLLYLPMHSELRSLQIGTCEGSTIEALENPFRHRIGIFGSSFTHGISTSRSGMAYASQFERATGIQMLNLGCSGNCKMQDYFADVFVDADVEAFVFDCFSNPTIRQIKDRLFPFIEKVQAAHPGKPLIFQSTIYRENRNFNTATEKFESERAHVVDSLMAIAVKKYPDIYYIHPSATSPTHETSVDGIHPGDYGYTLWMESIKKPILRKLRKYGIR